MASADKRRGSEHGTCCDLKLNVAIKKWFYFQHIIHLDAGEDNLLGVEPTISLLKIHMFDFFKT